MLDSLFKRRKLHQIVKECGCSQHHEEGLTHSPQRKGEDKEYEEVAVEQEERVEYRARVAFASFESLVHLPKFRLIVLVLEELNRNPDEVENNGRQEEKSKEKSQRQKRRNHISWRGERELKLKSNYVKKIKKGAETQLKERLNQSADYWVPYNRSEHSTSAALHSFVSENEFDEERNESDRSENEPNRNEDPRVIEEFG